MRYSIKEDAFVVKPFLFTSVGLVYSSPPLVSIQLYYCNILLILFSTRLFHPIHSMSKYSPNSRCLPWSCLLAVYSQQFAYFFLARDMFLYSLLKQRNLVPRSSRLIVHFSGNYAACRTNDVIFHISQNSSKFGRQLLVMMNYAWDISQSETEKYFE